MEIVYQIDAKGNELKKDPTTGLDLCMKANALGTVAIQSSSYERAESLLKKALEKYSATRDQVPYSHLLYNQGNLYMALKDHAQALKCYHDALLLSPFRDCKDFTPIQGGKTGQFNSQSCYAHTLSNLAVIYLLMSTGKASVSGEYQKCTEVAQKCIRLALQAMPEGEGTEAYINMNNVMRQMGCKTEAFNYTWMSVGKSFGDQFVKPQEYQCAKEEKTNKFEKLSFVCVKYGTKYGADYVNKLYYGVKTNCSLEFDFTCFTENPEGLDSQIKVQPLKNKWQGWWSKVHIFDPECYPEPNTRVFYIDLDMIISGSLDTLAQLPVQRFATLSTDEIFCENVEGGYNSSIMIFDSQAMQVLYQTLVSYYGHLLKYLMRFDHFLEMMCWDATLIQKDLPGQVLDYMQTFGGEKKVTEVPQDCRVIAFPRQPKPHEIDDKWAGELWVYKPTPASV